MKHVRKFASITIATTLSLGLLTVPTPKETNFALFSQPAVAQQINYDELKEIGWNQHSNNFFSIWLPGTWTILSRDQARETFRQAGLLGVSASEVQLETGLYAVVPDGYGNFYYAFIQRHPLFRPATSTIVSISNEMVAKLMLGGNNVLNLDYMTLGPYHASRLDVSQSYPQGGFREVKHLIHNGGEFYEFTLFGTSGSFDNIEPAAAVMFSTLSWSF